VETTVRGIVLRRKDSGESDRRLTLFSFELGKLDVVAKGARGAKSRLKGVSEPLSIATFTFAAGKKQRFVTQAQPESSYRGLRTDYDRIVYALAFAEAMSYVLPYEEPFPEAFELLERVLGVLETHPKPKAALVWAEVRLLELTGFMPSFGECVISGQPIQEAEAFLSPTAGGYLARDQAGNYSDRFLARAEVLYNLNAIFSLKDPPSSLKFADETLVALNPFWTAICEAPLPARKHLLESMMGTTFQVK
jgi:DNA repair protein RecO (recombination protein O)